MKTLKITALLTAVAALASCGGGGGLDEGTEKAIAAFDSSWNVTLNQANEWVSNAKNELGEWEASHANVDTTAPAACQTLVADATDIVTAAEEGIGSWSADGSWADWKKKVDDGEVSQEDATKGLESWTPKLGAANMAMGEWATKWGELKANHETAHASMMPQ